jgi:hypothetical protein
MVSHTCNPSTQDAKAGGAGVPDHLGYTGRPCFKKPKQLKKPEDVQSSVCYEQTKK